MDSPVLNITARNPIDRFLSQTDRVRVFKKTLPVILLLLLQKKKSRSDT
jgi:hypothetical protein